MTTVSPDASADSCADFGADAGADSGSTLAELLAFDDRARRAARDSGTGRAARLSLRLPAPALSRLREAADLLGQDVTSFVVATALDRAFDVLEREGRMRLHMAAIAADPERFARDPRIPDDPELAVMCHEALRAQAERDRRRAERLATDVSDDAHASDPSTASQPSTASHPSDDNPWL